MRTLPQKCKTLDYFKDYNAFAEKYTFHTFKYVYVHEYRSLASEPIDYLLLLKVVCSYSGGKYISFALKSFLASHGLQCQPTVAYPPQKNGLTESA